MLAKAGQFVKSLPGLLKPYIFDLFFLACVVLIAIISYNLGRIHALEKTTLKVGEGAVVYDAGEAENGPLTANAAKAAAPKVQQPRDPRVVVSKASSSKLYHFTWCAGAKQIKETNKVWFAGEAEARAAGYTLAANCQ